jgi:hypothetical protein
MHATMTTTLARWGRVGFALTLALILAAPVARAADVTYPPGSRIGLSPPDGMTVSKGFTGFEDADNQVGFILAALPPQAYAELEKPVSPELFKRQGLTLEGREPMTLASLPGGKAFLMIGHVDADKTKIRKWILVAASAELTALVTVQVPEAARARYSDAVVRAALASVTIRSVVPNDEQLGLLPFSVSDLAGFKIGGVIPGRAVMLSDFVPDPTTPAPTQIGPHFFVAIAPGGPAQMSEADVFAREVFGGVPNLKEVRITSAERLRISNAQGYQIMADAKDAVGGAALTVVQWLRFGGGGYLQMIGVSPAEAWKDAYPRFRSVRDGIEPR